MLTPRRSRALSINLAVNARDAMPHGGKLTIETANSELDDHYARTHDEVRAGQYVMISVTDTGSGMSQDVIDRAFEPFFTTKGVGRGTGLGLSQVFGFVKQSDGHLKIYSEVGKGSTMRIYLPRYLGDAASTELQASNDSVIPAREGEVVLVAEDDAEVRAMTVGMLIELGYQVVETGNGAEALAALEKGIDVTLLFADIVMPGMTGRELAEQAIQIRPSLKLLYATGYTRNSIVHNGMGRSGHRLHPEAFRAVRSFTQTARSDRRLRRSISACIDPENLAVEINDVKTPGAVDVEGHRHIDSPGIGRQIGVAQFIACTVERGAGE